ncbi:hypothetical protein EYF80_047527 [Liparis tanakae]|uniref:Uncharacterized protein n=1 Tax=Liparis tanakae TaxID=230148 RepID=A0A4Z2FNF4_9TELE|nr:hypothetical protein EYF80_047527 [Liparis tanakae]
MFSADCGPEVLGGDPDLDYSQTWTTARPGLQPDLDYSQQHVLVSSPKSHTVTRVHLDNQEQSPRSLLVFIRARIHLKAVCWLPLPLMCSHSFRKTKRKRVHFLSSMGKARGQSDLCQ